MCLPSRYRSFRLQKCKYRPKIAPFCYIILFDLNYLVWSNPVSTVSLLS
jgi:hypothetical protein